MTLDDQSVARLIAFCKRLPELPTDLAEAQREARFVLDCFARRRRELDSTAIAEDSSGQGFAQVRCELQALSAASRVIEHVLKRCSVAIPATL